MSSLCVVQYYVLHAGLLARSLVASSNELPPPKEDDKAHGCCSGATIYIANLSFFFVIPVPDAHSHTTRCAYQAKADTRIAGFSPWHFNNRSSPQHGPPCDMELGAVAMPDVVTKLKQIGEYILG